MSHHWTHDQLLELKRFNTPSIANALEFCSSRSPLEGFNRDETCDFMPHMGPMVGHVVTAEYRATKPIAPGQWDEPQLMSVLEASPKPSIVVIRDVDSPDGIVGAPWGECMSNLCRAFGVVGTVTDGAIRDYDEMLNAGLHALARRLCVSHGYGHICSVAEPVEVFGTTVQTGDIIHADRHGFMVLPDDVGPELIETAHCLDRGEIKHIIAPSRQAGFTAKMWEQGVSTFVSSLAEAGFKKKSSQGIQ